MPTFKDHLAALPDNPAVLNTLKKKTREKWNRLLELRPDLSAEDLVQEAFIRFIDGRRTYRDEGDISEETFIGIFIMTIKSIAGHEYDALLARNAALSVVAYEDRRRLAERDKNYAYRVPIDEQRDYYDYSRHHNPDNPVMTDLGEQEAVRELRRALQDFFNNHHERRYWTICQLKAQGVAQTRIAQRLGISEGRVSQLMTQMVGDLRRHLLGNDTQNAPELPEDHLTEAWETLLLWFLESATPDQELPNPQPRPPTHF